MCAFVDWLRLYNNLAEAMESIQDFYTGLRIELFKYAVSMPGVSIKYILRGTRKKRDAPELHTPGKEAYEMLKVELVGDRAWSSVESMRRANQEYVRTNSTMRRCRRVLDYDTNALYRSTMLGTIPSGKEVIVHWPQTPGNVGKFIEVLKGDR